MKLDVSKIVASAKGRYKEKGLQRDLGLGSELCLPDKDEAFIISPELSWWESLTGIRGCPFGRMVQIAGKPDSGKSTTAMMFMKAAQEQGVLVILWDAEKKFGHRRYRTMGGNPDLIPTSKSKLIQEGTKQVSWFIQAAKEQDPNCRILVVWDSIGGTLNSTEDDFGDGMDTKEKAKLKKANGDFSKQPGVMAKEVGISLRRFNSYMERYRDTKTGDDTIAILAVNQVYANIGSVGFKEKGGSTPEYLSSLILQLARKADLTHEVKKQKFKYGITTRAKVRKNHLFDGKECIAELDLAVTATGICLFTELDPKKAFMVEEEGK